MIVERLIAGARAAGEARATLNDPNEAWLDLMTNGTRSLAGIEVSEEGSLQLATVAACVQRVSTSIAGMPIVIYRRTGARSRERVTDHPYAPILQVSPNPEQTAFELWEQAIGYAMLWEQAVIYIERRPGPGGNPLWALRPDRIKPHRVKDGPLKGRLAGYDVIVDPNTAESRFVKLTDTITIRAGGYTSKTLIQRARDGIGLGLAQQESASRFFAQGMSMAGWVQVPQGATQGEVDKLDAVLQSKHAGLTRQHLIGMLTGGAQWKEVGMPARDAQLIESREFAVEEVCRWFGVPPHKVGHLKRATFSNIEQQNIEYVVDTLGGWIARGEQALRGRIFNPPRGRYGKTGDTWAEWLVDGQLRGDTLTRYAAYALGIQWGFLTRNEVRERENLSDLDHLDEPLQPLNMVPAGTDPAAAAAPTTAQRNDTLAQAIAMLMGRNAQANGNGTHPDPADLVPTLPA